MSNLVQCTRCKKTMIDEEFNDHRCMPKITGFKKIKYADCYTVEDSQNRKIITIRGMDGIVYDFVEIPENKEYTKIPYQPIGNTNKNNRQDNSTLSN